MADINLTFSELAFACNVKKMLESGLQRYIAKFHAHNIEQNPSFHVFSRFLTLYDQRNWFENMKEKMHYWSCQQIY